MKKTIAILLILMILIMPVQAEANPILGSPVLTNPYVLGAAAVICGVGLVISSNEQLQQDISNLWNSASDTVATWLKGQVDYGTGYVDLNSAPVDVWEWIRQSQPPVAVNLVPVAGWPNFGYQFPVSRVGSVVDAKHVFTVNIPELTNIAAVGKGFYIYLSVTQSPYSDDYFNVISNYYDAAGNLVNSKKTSGMIYNGPSDYSYKKTPIWYAGGTAEANMHKTVRRVEIYMTPDPSRGVYGQTVTVSCGGLAYGTDTDPPATVAMPYNYSGMTWGSNIDEIIRPEVTPRVSNIAIPQTTDQLVGKDITQTPTVNIINIYNQTVPLSTSTPATVVPDPDNLEQGFSFLGTLIRPISSELSRVRKAVEDYTATNTEIDWSPVTNLSYSFTNKFPFSLPWDIQRAVASLTVTQDLPDIQVQFYNPTGGEPIQFTLVWPEFVSTFALWVRSAFLIIFGIGLVYSTSKLLGGAK